MSLSFSKFRALRLLVRESFCESGEGVRLPREGGWPRGSSGNFRGSPANFRGSPANFRGSLGNFRGTPGLLGGFFPIFPAQRALRDILMPRGKNWLPTVSRQFLTRNCPRPNCLLNAPQIASPPQERQFFLFQNNPWGSRRKTSG